MTRISGFSHFNYSSFGNFRSNSIYSSSRAGRSTYAQLLKARYGQTNSAGRISGSRISSSQNTARNKLQSMSNDLSTIKQDAEDLTRAVDKLNTGGKNDPFEKRSIKQSDGTTVTDYDKDAIYSAVNSFVESYNDTLKNASVSSDRNVANAATSMSRTTSILSKSLAKVGITAGKDGKLALDEKAFKNADMDTVKSLFQGTGSFADNVSYAAGRIGRAATSSLSSMTTGTYGASGYFGYGGYSALGNFFNGYF
ncbi:MAG: hypothetical protein IJ794_10370 [Lachnospiraceae bacterium]|nr:hypothetical protein [Lachnospiraceae bacterium]